MSSRLLCPEATSSFLLASPGNYPHFRFAAQPLPASTSPGPHNATPFHSETLVGHHFAVTETASTLSIASHHTAGRPPISHTSMRPEAVTKWRCWRDALRSRPQSMGTRPPRSVALQIDREHVHKTRTSYAIRD